MVFRILTTHLLAAFAALALMAVAPRACALDAAQAHAIAAGEVDDRVAAIGKAAASGDAGFLPLAQALLDDAVKVDARTAYIVREGQAVDAATGRAAVVPADAEDAVTPNRLRAELQGALSALRLRAPDRAVRAGAVDELAQAGIDESQRPMLAAALAAEHDQPLRTRLAQLIATVDVASSDRARRLEAAQVLGLSDEPAVRGLLQQRLAPDGEADPEVRRVLVDAQSAVERRLAWTERLGVLFTGASLGSILLLVALGLAISYGLMGVINMAHGELMMIGAYATWLVQGWFRAHWPAAFDAYLLVAVPVSFAVSAGVGALLERLVIRHLYGRPLETLLATWGLSLALMQAVRSLFGAQNVQVENPSWLSGGWQVASNLVLPWNRIAILVFAGLVLGGVALLIARTRLGLFVRAVTQNRAMAACTGVDTGRTDMMAFALGAGVAGLAGCALSQVGNVGPDLGQGYIVDAFMVVVLGGVGQLAGTVCAALGLGLLAKALEGVAGAVLAKIAVLVFIVVFIQKRPQGLFAMKGRSADA